MVQFVIEGHRLAKAVPLDTSVTSASAQLKNSADIWNVFQTLFSPPSEVAVRKQ